MARSNKSRSKESPGCCPGLRVHNKGEWPRGNEPLDASILSQGTNRARRGSRRRAAAIVFSYDRGHIFCALNDVFAKFVTAHHRQRLNAGMTKKRGGVKESPGRAGAQHSLAGDTNLRMGWPSCRHSETVSKMILTEAEAN